MSRSASEKAVKQTEGSCVRRRVLSIEMSAGLATPLDTEAAGATCSARVIIDLLYIKVEDIFAIVT